MTEISSKNQPRVQALTDTLGERIVAIKEHRGQLTVEIAREHWLDAAWMLRDEPSLAFEQLSDLCGIDYLCFGASEWETAEATGSGFSRADEGLGPGRFSCADRPAAGEI